MLLQLLVSGHFARCLAWLGAPRLGNLGPGNGRAGRKPCVPLTEVVIEAVVCPSELSTLG